LQQRAEADWTTIAMTQPVAFGQEAPWQGSALASAVESLRRAPLGKAPPALLSEGWGGSSRSSSGRVDAAASASASGRSQRRRLTVGLGFAFSISASNLAAMQLCGLASRRRRRQRVAGGARAGAATGDDRCQVLVCRAAGERDVEIAVNIGRQADSRRRMDISQQERKRLRAQEVRRKVDVLKGKVDTRYVRNRDKEAGVPGSEDASEGEEDNGEAGDEEDYDEDEEDYEDYVARKENEEGAVSTKIRKGEDGLGKADWAFERPDPTKPPVDSVVPISQQARAVALTELEGDGGALATAGMLLEAGIEFKWGREWTEAAQLLELARERIDSEQLNFKLDYKAAQVMDDEALAELASVYSSWGRLTMAFNRYEVLKERALDTIGRKKAQAGWVNVAFRLCEDLYAARRFEECLEVIYTVRDTAQTNVAGDKVKEELELYVAMTLQSLNRVEEAIKVLSDFRRNTGSRSRKAQAMFMIDVFRVDTSGERNEEFHKVWEQHPIVYQDGPGGYQGGGGRGAPLNLNLSPREKEWKSWAAEYWDEKMKSPLYYMFLVLFVTWPLAIPVISILKRMDIIPA